MKMKMKICISDKDVLQINWIIIANHQQLSIMWLTPDNVNTTRWPRKNVKPFRMSPFFFLGQSLSIDSLFLYYPNYYYDLSFKQMDGLALGVLNGQKKIYEE